MEECTGSLFKKKVKMMVEMRLADYLSFLDRFSIQHILIIDVLRLLQRVIKLTYTGRKQPIYFTL
jgi:hypothetical protein